MGQHGEIRFRDRDKCPDEKSDDDPIDRFLKRYDRFSDAFPHWLHRHVGTKRKQSHADDQQHGAGQKQQDRSQRHRSDGCAQQQYDERDRQYGGKSFIDLFF